VSGLDHGGGSYELRIFLDNPAADSGTPLEAAAGYAGSIHVYGQGRPLPGAGDETEPVPDAVTRPPRSIVATEAVRAQASRAEGSKLSVTLVAVAAGGQGANVDLDASQVSVRID
jgi:hypothetical protein